MNIFLQDQLFWAGYDNERSMHDSRSISQVLEVWGLGGLINWGNLELAKRNKVSCSCDKLISCELISCDLISCELISWQVDHLISCELISWQVDLMRVDLVWVDLVWVDLMWVDVCELICLSWSRVSWSRVSWSRDKLISCKLISYELILWQVELVDLMKTWFSGNSSRNNWCHPTKSLTIAVPKLTKMSV